MAKGMVRLYLALPFSTRWLLPNEGDDACLSLRRRIAGPLASIAQQSDELGSGGGSVFSWLRSGHFARLMGAHPVTSPLVANRSRWRSAVLIHDKSGALHRLYSVDNLLGRLEARASQRHPPRETQGSQHRTRSQQL